MVALFDEKYFMVALSEASGSSYARYPGADDYHGIALCNQQWDSR
jgi:hypothetical protein